VWARPIRTEKRAFQVPSEAGSAYEQRPIRDSQSIPCAPVGLRRGLTASGKIFALATPLRTAGAIHSLNVSVLPLQRPEPTAMRARVMGCRRKSSLRGVRHETVADLRREEPTGPALPMQRAIRERPLPVSWRALHRAEDAGGQSALTRSDARGSRRVGGAPPCRLGASTRHAPCSRQEPV